MPVYEKKKSKKKADLPLLYEIDDGIKLETSVKYDDITNKIIKKINNIEITLNNCVKYCKEIPKIQNDLENHDNLLYSHTNKLKNLENKINEFNKILNEHSNTLKDMKIKMEDFNIAEIFKNNLGENGGDLGVALGLISNLEKKLNKKLEFTDQRIAKNDESLMKMENEVNNIKNSNDLVLRNIETFKKNIEDNNNKIENLMKELNELEKRLNDSMDIKDKNLEDKLLETLKNFEPKTEKKEDSSVLPMPVLTTSSDNKEINDLINQLNKRLIDAEKQILLINSNLNLEGINSAIEEINKVLNTKVNYDEYNNLKDNFLNLQNQFNYLKEQFDDFTTTNMQTDHEDIQTLKRKVESINNKVHDLELSQNNDNNLINNNLSKLGNDNKYVEYSLFNEFKNQAVTQFNSVNDNFVQIRHLIDDLVDSFKQKTTFKDLKALEDDLMSKLEDLRLSCLKKFADKSETSKNIKYLDTQIKHIIQVYIQKAEKGENWLLAKKPLNGNLCASCESYIGELKDNTPYVPWNKYPNRDPNDKLYRMGNGFSKMLQMVQVEDKDINLETTKNNTLDKSKGNLPKIKTSRILNKTDYDNNNNKNQDLNKATINFESDEDGQPKITKIYKMNNVKTEENK